MKKLVVFTIMALALAIMTSCTEQQRSRNFGSSMTVQIDSGYKLVEATWKGDNLWILTEPMEKDYIPKTKIFKESSSFGIMEGSITFVERK